MIDLGTLRAIREDELAKMLEWRNAPATRANMYTRHEISLEEHLAWWSRTRTRDDQTYFMYEREGKPLGIVGFTLIDRANNNACWAFYAASDAPPGTGSRMEILALDHAFSELDLHKLYCEVLDFNKPVIKLHHKFGFQTEGIFRAHHLHEGGYIDIHRLGLLAEEWKAQRPTMLAKLQAAMRTPT